MRYRLILIIPDGREVEVDADKLSPTMRLGLRELLREIEATLAAPPDPPPSPVPPKPSPKFAPPESERLKPAASGA